jgi:hypothetical protein
MTDSVGFRTLDNMKASKFAISGTRKVACVVSIRFCVENTCRHNNMSESD